MGVDLDVVFAATLTAEEAFALPERLNHSLPVVTACRAYHEHEKRFTPGLEYRPWHWDDEFGPPLGSPADIEAGWDAPYVQRLWLRGVESLWIERTRIAMRFSKIHAFATDAGGCQAPIRGVCRAVAGALGADRVLYIPDSGEWAIPNLDQLTFTEACAQLAAWGPPVRALGALGFGTATRNGYVYEDGALRHPDGTALTEDEIYPGLNRSYAWTADGQRIVRDRAGRLLSPEEADRPNLHGGFAYYIDDFRDLA